MNATTARVTPVTGPAELGRIDDRSTAAEARSGRSLRAHLNPPTTVIGEAFGLLRDGSSRAIAREVIAQDASHAARPCCPWIAQSRQSTSGCIGKQIDVKAKFAG